MLNARPLLSLLVPLALSLAACSSGTTPPANKPAAPAAPAAAPAATPAASAGAAVPAAAPAAPPARRTINYGLVNLSAFYWPFYIGMDEGIFAADGFDLELVITRSGPDGMAALLGGSIELNTTNTEVVMLAQARGADAIGVAGLHNRASYSLMVQPEYTRVTDLRGKRLGASATRAGEALFMKALLQRYGLGENDYDLVVAGPSRNRVSAMTARQLDATVMPPPDNYVLEDAGIRRLAEVSEAITDYQFQVLAVTRPWAQANEEMLVRFLRAYVRTLEWLYDPANKERATVVLRDRMQVSDDHAARTYTQWIEQERMFSARGEVTPAGLTATEEMLVSTGELPGALPPRERYLDLRYLERAQQAR